MHVVTCSLEWTVRKTVARLCSLCYSVKNGETFCLYRYGVKGSKLKMMNGRRATFFLLLEGLFEDGD